MPVNRKRMGFTVIELLMALAIISMLVGILIPALSMVRKAAREVKQKAQFTGIELALGAFKNDYGDYPPSDQFSHYTTPPINDYCGAQKLAEALLGWDLLGFHPKSAWRADGCDPARNPVYSPADPNLRQRKGPYLELATANAFRLGISAAGKRDGLFDSTGKLVPDRYVICDVFGIKKVTVIKPLTLEPITFYAGTPVLYFKANTSSKTIVPPPPYIYDIDDNVELINLRRVSDGKPHSIYNLSTFVPYIADPKASTETRPWPYRPDSYILISAGADGFYGTPDDIRNFGY
jgi:type II secretory pathway pseudopilin PulG